MADKMSTFFVLLFCLVAQCVCVYVSDVQRLVYKINKFVMLWRSMLGVKALIGKLDFVVVAVALNTILWTVELVKLVELWHGIQLTFIIHETNFLFRSSANLSMYLTIFFWIHRCHIVASNFIRH